MSITHAGRAAAVTTSTDVDPDEGYPAGTAEYRRVLVALFLAGVATFVLLYDPQAILTALASSFSVSPGRSTLSMSVTTVVLALALLVAAPVSEVAGRTRMIRWSMAASSVVALGCALAPTWDSFLVLRGLEGLALAGLPAVATTYLREELHPTTHARAAGIYIGGTALGGMLGRLVPSPVAELVGWRWGLAAAGLLAVACAVAVHLVLPPSRRFEPRPVRARAVAAGFREAVADRGLVALYVLGGLGMGGLVATLNALGFRLEARPFALSLGLAGLVFLVYPLGTVASTVAGWTADLKGRRAVLPWGAVIAVVGVVLTLSGSLSVVVAGVALVVIGFFVMHGLASGWVVVRAHRVGASPSQAASVYLFTYYVGSSVFGSLGGHLWSTAGWPGVAGLSGTLFALCGLTGWVLRGTC